MFITNRLNIENITKLEREAGIILITIYAACKEKRLLPSGSSLFIIKQI
jgi:hypothetical protein